MFIYVGGIIGMCCIVDFVLFYQVCIGLYGLFDLLLVCMVVVLYFDLWVFNFGVQEFMGYFEQMLEVFLYNWMFEGGYRYLGDKSGLGIEFDEKLVVKYLYDLVYLLVVCLEDGILWNW